MIMLSFNLIFLSLVLCEIKEKTVLSLRNINDEVNYLYFILLPTCHLCCRTLPTPS